MATLPEKGATRFRPYPEYRDSGVEWLGGIPVSWKVIKLKFATDLRNRKTEISSVGLPYIGLENIESWSGNLVDGESESDPSGIGGIFESGDILFGKLRPYLAKALCVTTRGICTTECLVLCPKLLTQRFLFYCLVTKHFIQTVDASTYGAKMPRANWEFIGNLGFPIPKREEQQAIADFLDRETVKIDALIEKKKKLIALLEEKRTALITRAVTKGLDPNVPMKDSGVEWLGKIPAHWEFVPLKWFISVRSGEALSNRDFDSQPTDERTVPVIGGNGVFGYSERSLASQKGLAVGRVGALCGNVHPVLPPAWVTDNALFINEIRDFQLAYLKEALTAMDLNRWASRNAQPLITGSFLKARRVPKPPQSEQTQIVSYVNKRLMEVDKITAKTSKAICLLQEYRTALISAAVTGKIDVRETATVREAAS